MHHTEPLWRGLDVAAALRALATDPDRGLTSDEAERRLRLVGLNRIAGPAETPLWRLLLRQFRSLVVILLLIAAALAAMLGDVPEGSYSPFWCARVVAAGILHGQLASPSPWRPSPRGLPAIVTVALAVGLWRLARAGALVRTSRLSRRWARRP